MSTEPGQIIVANPDDVNLADVKALAARYNATAVGNPHCPRGKIFVIARSALKPKFQPPRFGGAR